MLAYELYLNNKDSKSEAVKTLRLLKKIFVNKEKIEVDTKTLDEYGSDIIDAGQSLALNFLQQWLSMPLNTTDIDKLNLINKRTGTRSPLPYVKIYGKLIINKNKKEISIEIDGKDPENIKSKKVSFSSKLDLSTFTETPSRPTTDKIVLNIEKAKYQIGNDNLFKAYVDAGTITPEGLFENSLFNKVSTSFFEFVKVRPLPQENYPTFKINIPFEIFVLPSNNTIKFGSQSTGSESADNHFIDSFGNECSIYDSKTTQNAKFLSFDDLAFTLNGREGVEFYKNLGIGSESLEKINIPVKNVFKFAGLNWLFTNIINPYFRFREARRGFFAQLHESYQALLNESKGVCREQVQMKIICYNQNNFMSKVEILIDENLTMNRLRRIIQRSNSDPGPLYAFEDILTDTIVCSIIILDTSDSGNAAQQIMA
jgi:hypothetical protein